MFTHSWLLGFRRVILLGFCSYWLGRFWQRGKITGNQYQKGIQYSRKPRNPLFSGFSMEKIFGPKTSKGVLLPHGTVEKIFHGKARKQWIPRLSTMLNPFLILISRDFAPLPKFALANSYRNTVKSPFWNPKVKNCVAISSYNFRNVLWGMQCTNAVNGGRIERGWPRALPLSVLDYRQNAQKGID